MSDDEMAERFDELFDQAVTRSLTGEDLISLSGGVEICPRSPRTPRRATWRSTGSRCTP